MYKEFGNKKLINKQTTKKTQTFKLKPCAPENEKAPY